jgi:ATP-dependent Clp protease protease subunit
MKEEKRLNGDDGFKVSILKGPEDLLLEQMGFLYINGEITSESAFDFIKSFHRCIINGNVKDIFIFINSPGGSAGDAISIYENVRFLSKETDKNIITVGTAEIMSAATIILQAGNERIMTKNSVFMIHEMSWESEGSMSQHEDYKVGAEMMEEIMIAIITERCTDRNKKLIINKMKRKETYMDANKCKKLGLIDKVI